MYRTHIVIPMSTCAVKTTIYQLGMSVCQESYIGIAKLGV